MRVRYFVAADLVEALYRGLADNTAGKLIHTVLRNDLMLIDELGICSPRRDRFAAALPFSSPRPASTAVWAENETQVVPDPPSPAATAYALDTSSSETHTPAHEGACPNCRSKPPLLAAARSRRHSRCIWMLLRKAAGASSC